MARSIQHASRTEPQGRRFWGLFGVALGLIACRASEAATTGDERALKSNALAAAASASAACGEPGMAECPTQRWMKATLQAFLRTRDYKRLEASFKELAAHPPAGYERWREMALSGARAAAQRDEEPARKACQDCHDTHRARFRSEMRSTPLF
jgi:hypothetical protein